MPTLLATCAFLLWAAACGVAVGAPSVRAAAPAAAPLPLGASCASGPISQSDTFVRAHRCVTTTHLRAQAAFDDGLTLLYAFNPEEARRSFETAIAEDPALAIAWWGIAMSHGPNINVSFQSAEQLRGREAIGKAAKLDIDATPAERALIAAASQRFAFDRPSDENRAARTYRDAMYAAATAFPDDDDVRTLAAEAEMDLHPWSYFTKDGKPTAGTLGLIAHLAAVLARSPSHLGANHFAIHAFEESSQPEEASASARRLAAMHFAPAAEHLVHMPAHTFMRVGDYHAAGEANARAIASYDDYLAHDHAGHADYYGHDCAFGVDAYMMAGERARASALAETCRRGNGDQRQLVNLRFRDWKALGAAGGADEFGAAMLLARDGRLGPAEKQLRALQASSDPVSAIESAVLDARIARTRGTEAAEIAALQHAVSIQDGYGYAEPPTFWYPVRETLGGAFLRAGRYDDAERTFLADLERNRENPRALFGLAAALEHLNRSVEAKAVRARFARAWAQADSELDLNEL